MNQQQINTLYDGADEIIDGTKLLLNEFMVELDTIEKDGKKHYLLKVYTMNGLSCEIAERPLNVTKFIAAAQYSSQSKAVNQLTALIEMRDNATADEFEELIKSAIN